MQKVVAQFEEARASGSALATNPPLIRHSSPKKVAQRFPPVLPLTRHSPFAIRPTAIGKKNWLFIGEAEAGQRSAILFTIIEACRSRCIEPQTYLHEVLTRLPTLTNRQIKDVTPEAWAKAKRIDNQQKAA